MSHADTRSLIRVLSELILQLGSIAVNVKLDKNRQVATEIPYISFFIFKLFILYMLFALLS